LRSRVLGPWYLAFRQLGLYDTQFALIVTHLTLNLPMTVWLMMAFFNEIPRELEEAALVDGCRPVRAFWRITFGALGVLSGVDLSMEESGLIVVVDRMRKVAPPADDRRARGNSPAGAPGMRKARWAAHVFPQRGTYAYSQTRGDQADRYPKHLGAPIRPAAVFLISG
jgi:hypothetical protein